MVVVILLLPIIIYVWHFHSYPISDNPVDWGTFGDYIGGIYSVLVALLAVYISHHLEDRKKRRSHSREAAENLFQQIQTIRNNKYNFRSIAKLQKLIGTSELYLNSMLLEKISALADCYLRYKNDKEDIDEDLEKETLQELERIYAK